MKKYSANLLDAYKIGHADQYPEGTTRVVSNFTCRASRLNGVKDTVFFGLQYYVLEYLINEWDQFFTDKDAPKKFARHAEKILGFESMEKRLLQLKGLGYLPIQIRALPEGTHVPLRVPCFTIHNTHPDFYWITNFLETQISTSLWQPITSATIAREFRKNFARFANLTSDNLFMVDYQGHDFSMRGLSSVESGMLSAAGHALFFLGSDSVPVIDFYDQFYGPVNQEDVVIKSVPATEHAVMCVGIAVEGKELETVRRLITKVYPKGFVSVVSDTMDFWYLVSHILPQLRNEIMSRDGKVVIRPDSGDPFSILCGDPHGSTTLERAGLIKTLYAMFPGPNNSKGYKTLDPHVGVIYGDSITLDLQYQILNWMALEGFASDFLVLGIGSYTYQYNTRDTFGCAIKATYAEVNGKSYNIFKAPKTDSGIKKSMKGLPYITYGDDGKILLQEEATWEAYTSDSNLLRPVFEDGKIFRYQDFKEIREIAQAPLKNIGLQVAKQ